MGRRDTYRNERKLRRKYVLTVFLCCALLVSGLCVVDYSTNVLVYNTNSIDILSVQSHKNSLELSLFNKKLYINTSYIGTDLERLSEYFRKLF